VLLARPWMTMDVKGKIDSVLGRIRHSASAKNGSLFSSEGKPVVSIKAQRSLYAVLWLALLSPRPTAAQDAQSVSSSPQEPENKRIFGIIPNYRTSPNLKDYKPLTIREKWTIAAEDSFDRGTVLLAAGFGGEGLFFDSSPSFGGGAKGYARYAAASYAYWTIGNVMTEGLYPTLLRQDPRYFRRGEGSGWSRLRYAIGQTVWTHSDSGRTHFNFSEILGNSTAVALSNLYYPDNRTAANGFSKLATQIGVDMAANILKEFSPDWVRARSRKDRAKAP